MARNFRAEIDEAAARQDWDKVSQIYDERRCAEVDYDESALWAAHSDDAIFNRKDAE